ncbi:MAG: hypothetical protein ACM3VS_00320, partial [Candidatus Dadabacteria bacterium]
MKRWIICSFLAMATLIGYSQANTGTTPPPGSKVVKSKVKIKGIGEPTAVTTTTTSTTAGTTTSTAHKSGSGTVTHKSTASHKAKSSGTHKKHIRHHKSTAH